MEALLAPASRPVGYLVCQSLWRSRAPLHRNTGSVMAGGYWKELELRGSPRLCPRRSYKDVGCPQGPGDPGTDHQADGPLG